VLATATPALAQGPRTGRPYRGLFGGGAGDAEQLLTASGSLGGGWDNDVVADILGQSGGVTRDGSRAGTVASASGALAYSLATEATSMGLSVASSARYYPGNATDLIQATQGRATFRVTPRQGTSLSLNLSVAHQPYQLASLYPVLFEPELGDAPVADLDVIGTVDPYFRYSGSAGVTQRVSRRASLSANYDHQRADRGEAGEYVNQNLGGSLTYNIGKGLDARAGYGYGETQFGDGTTRDHHAIDAGINYNRALSISRQTTLSFSTGSTAMRSNERLRFIFTGSATLNREIGRTWNAFVGYSRRVHLNETWLEPVVSDGLTAGFGGLISRRVQFSSVARGAVGKQGLESDAPGFDTVRAAATLSYAVTRFLNLGITYAFYNQRFDDGVQLSVGEPINASRHSVRATVGLWAPLFQRVRRD
jgi:hypothetical protein